MEGLGLGFLKSFQEVPLLISSIRLLAEAPFGQTEKIKTEMFLYQVNTDLYFLF